MKTTILQLIFKGALLFIMAFTIISCSDEHFDINEDVLGQQTLWKQISSNPELSDFANLLDMVYVSKSEGNPTPVKYSELLDHDQHFTIWAPKNGSFDHSFYENLLETNPYIVEKELIQNHMTRYNRILNSSDSVLLNLYNSKTTVFDCPNAMIGGNKISTPNIGCSNGVLHIIDGAIEYMPNIYEYIGRNPKLDSLKTFLKRYEKLDFDEYSSTQGPTVNGNITWVDSVTHLYNDYFHMMSADLTCEDSVFAMVMPDNNAWENALKKTSAYFKYMNNYTQTMTTVDEEGNESSTTLSKKFTEAEVDSITNLYSKNAICENLVFNAKYQAKPFNINNPADCDSLESTVRNVFEQPLVVDIFNNAKPETLSNGYAYVVDSFEYRPSDTWAQDIKIEAEQGYNVENSNRCTLAPTMVTETAGDSLLKTTIVRVVQSSPSVNPEVTFKLANTLSCKYDIYVLMAYNTNANMPTKFKVSISYFDGKRSSQTSTTLKPTEGNIHADKSNTFTNFPPNIEENVLVDSILVAQDFSLPTCCYGLDFYPTLKIAVQVSSKEISTYTREMWIDKIVLVAKE
ncbi:MAG: fasciclin domain-containing protein [Bacteroidaceae bacterium]|nr:fasciclin domain-containing protein [Bacteroidaceae bacterium]